LTILFSEVTLIFFLFQTTSNISNFYFI